MPSKSIGSIKTFFVKFPRSITTGGKDGNTIFKPPIGGGHPLDPQRYRLFANLPPINLNLLINSIPQLLQQRQNLSTIDRLNFPLHHGIKTARNPTHIALKALVYTIIVGIAYTVKPIGLPQNPSNPVIARVSAVFRGSDREMFTDTIYRLLFFYVFL